MISYIVIGLLIVLCVWLAIRWHQESGWKASYESVITSLGEVAQARDQERAKLIEAEEKCGNCFLDQAALRKALKDKTAHCTATEDRLLAKLDENDALKRSNAALRGTVTRLTAKKAKKA